MQAKKTKLIKKLKEDIIGDDTDKLKNIDDIFDNVTALELVGVKCLVLLVQELLVNN